MNSIIFINYLYVYLLTFYYLNINLFYGVFNGLMMNHYESSFKQIFALHLIIIILVINKLRISC